VQAFLFREARTLDEERFGDWLQMLAPDIHYWLPIRENRFRKDRRPQPTPDNAASVYNDKLEDLEHRVARFDSGMAWIEDPPARVRRLVTNIEAETTDKENELAVYSNILLYRNRRQDEEAWFVAARRDRLRDVNGQWLLAKRHIVFDQHVILDENLSVFL
jgi:3-phenylpropionate/cinnamic acid dioxygenase small subunit